MRQASFPYCTITAFRKGLDAIARLPPGRRADRDALVALGISRHAAYPIVGALRFLGLVEPDGTLTSRVAAFLDPADVEGRRGIVLAAYRQALPDLKLPVRDREDVDRLLVEQFGCARGVAPFCSTLMLWLLAESGLPVGTVRQVRRGRPPAYLAQVSAPARERILRDAAAIATGAGATPASGHDPFARASDSIGQPIAGAGDPLAAGRRFGGRSRRRAGST